MSGVPTRQVLVKAMRHEAQGVCSVELVPLEPHLPDGRLPPFTAGAHIDLHLPSGPVRSYSLVNQPGDASRYVIGVHLHPASRGGSRHVHTAMRPGDVISMAGPRNHFQLAEDAPHSVFIAGGIGITPLLSMMRRLNELARPWELHYAARTRAQAGFLDDVRELCLSGHGRLTLALDGEPGAEMLDLQRIVAQAPADAHLYCCGPAGMLDAFTTATDGIAPSRVHLEYFAAREKADTAGGFEVRCARSATHVQVRPGQSVLHALLEHGVQVPFACEEGICGSCEVGVLEGTPDHRDAVLSQQERDAGKTMMACCSGAKSDVLVLDI
ncbi:PDR/VanB family oxidoreductase [Hydrogenophaga sp.]|uniref:PDR/VanB family oxidoreductase n=1 Tax=Hydrogenophaga sp. TaxID=1904254 RepID=UPI003F708BDF